MAKGCIKLGGFKKAREQQSWQMSELALLFVKKWGGQCLIRDTSREKGRREILLFLAKSPPSYCKRHKTQYSSAHHHKNHTAEPVRDRNYKILLTPFPVPPLPPRIAHSTIKLYTFFPVPSFASNFKSVFFFSFPLFSADDNEGKGKRWKIRVRLH